MQDQTRFVKSIIATAKADTPALPWHRGEPRMTMIARRRALLDKPIRPQRKRA